MKVMFDTGVLIALTCETRPSHMLALECLRSIKAQGHLLVVSPLALAEYAVQNDMGQLIKMAGIDDVPLYNILHAETAGRFRRVIKGQEPKDDVNRRAVVVNDVQILAQAYVEAVDLVLTEDRKTFLKNAKKLYEEGLITMDVVGLHEEDALIRFLHIGQRELGI